MKKIIAITILIMSMFCMNFSFATSIENVFVENEHINEEIFRKILFDYNFLTQNTNIKSQSIFDSLKNDGMTIIEKNFIKNLDIEKQTCEEIVLFIQNNYVQLTNEMNESEKEILDKYLLDNSLKYYYNLLGDTFVYTEEVIERYNDNVQSNSRLSENVVSIKVCSDPCPDYGASRRFRIRSTFRTSFLDTGS